MRYFHYFFMGVTTLVLLTACTTPSAMGYRSGNLYMQTDNVVTALKGREVAQKRTNFSSMFLQQKTLQLEAGNLAVYEFARTDLSYEFEPPLSRILDVIFDTRRKILIYARGGFFAYQIAIPGRGILNLVAEFGDSQELKLFYGMNNRQFNRILNRLDPNAPPPYYKQVITFRQNDQAVVTKWDDMKVHFYPLVVPLPRLMMPF